LCGFMQFAGFQEQRNAEEQERLRKMQAEMEAVRRAKEEEERRLREEEETRRKKAEMETRRKQEEAERLRQEEEDRRTAQALQVEILPFHLEIESLNLFCFQDQLAKEIQDDAQYRQQLEQERRDHELAMRLAQESNGQVEDSPPLLRKYVDMILFFSSILFDPIF
jgi:myosin VI